MRRIYVFTRKLKTQIHHELTQRVIKSAPNGSRIDVFFPGIYDQDLDFAGKSGITLNLLPGVIYTGQISNLGNNKVVQLTDTVNVAEGSWYKYGGVNAFRLAKGNDNIFGTTIIGANAGNPNLARQTAVGYGAGYGNTGTNQTALGYIAG